MRVAESLEQLRDTPDNWVAPRAGIDHDVAVVGAGQSGLSIAFALRRAGITRTTVVDGAVLGQEGTWNLRARMRTLRTPKALPGPELGIPALTFEAWYTAMHGSQAYAQLPAMQTRDWAAYLAWYRLAIGVPVRNATVLERIVPTSDHFVLHLRCGAHSVRETARKVVLATGIAGGGAPLVPAWMGRSLPLDRYTHTHDAIDFEGLRGRRVAVLGAGSSAFDAAATALESGAAEVRMFCRGRTLVHGNRLKAMSHPGIFEHFHELSAADRWTLMHWYKGQSASPTLDSVQRAMQFTRFHLHLGHEIERACVEAGDLVLCAGGHHFAVDHLILATGYSNQLSERPELQDLHASIAVWGDRYAPPEHELDEALGSYPYMGPAFEFTEKQPGQAPFLRDLHFFCAPAMVSHGRPVGDTGSIKYGVPRLVSSVGRDLLLADRDWHLQHLRRDTDAELSIDDYARSIWAAKL